MSAEPATNAESAMSAPGEPRHGEVPADLLSQLLRLSHDAIFVWRQGGAIEFWNHGAEELYGYAAHEALGKRPVELLGAGPLAGRAEIIESLHKAGQWAGELRHRCRAGREI